MLNYVTESLYSLGSHLCFLISAPPLEGTLHPHILTSPTIHYSRIQIHMWAIVRIQRCFRRFVKRKQAVLQAKKKMANTKERWKKKIEGDDYKAPTPPPPEPAAPPPPREKTKEEKKQEEEEYMRSDLLYSALFIDKLLSRRRRKSFSEESDFVKDFYEKQLPPQTDKGGHR